MDQRQSFIGTHFDLPRTPRADLDACLMVLANRSLALEKLKFRLPAWERILYSDRVPGYPLSNQLPTKVEYVTAELQAKPGQLTMRLANSLNGATTLYNTTCRPDSSEGSTTTSMYKVAKTAGQLSIAELDEEALTLVQETGLYSAGFHVMETAALFSRFATAVAFLKEMPVRL